ncbi:MAG TPA: hypothetical protein VFX79_01120 [Candidatus Saccharimonadales bacterium]|nr:hypothetical protein [Candidatus Saccharimonadales bacterium]
MSVSEVLYPVDLERSPEVEPSIKYTLPFEWGTFRVSEAADEAYGLTPLASGKIDGSSNEVSGDEVPTPRADIWMLAPSELDMADVLQAEPSAQGVPVGAFVGARRHEGGISVVCGLNKDRKTIETQFKQMFEDQAREALGDTLEDGEEISAEDMIGLSGEQKGLSLAEIIERNTTQTIIQRLCAKQLPTPLSANIESWIRRASDLESLQHIGKQGKIALGAGAAVILGGTLATLETPSPVDDITLALAAIAFVGMNFRKLNELLAGHMRARDEAEDYIREFAFRGSMNITSDIYKAYSTEYFDRQFSGLLGDPPSENQ